MTRTIAACALLIASTLAEGRDGGPTRPWTLLIYAAVDNNADGPFLQFLDQVRKAIDDDPGLETLLFIDRAEFHPPSGQSVVEDFSGARLYRVRLDSAERLSGGTQFPDLTLEADPELDSADASNIRRFIAWGKAESPAKRYALLIYSHANGQTMCPDEDSGGDMGIPELTDEAGSAERVDFLALELCNMGGVEIAYQWRPGTGRFSADVLLAIPNAGPPLDWDRAFARIRSKGHACPVSQPAIDPATMTAADFGGLVIEEGHAGRVASAEQRRGGDGKFESAAAYDLAAAGAVKEAVDALARALATSDGRSAFFALRQNGGGGGAMNYTRGGPYVDLYDLCERAAADEALSADVRGAARSVMEGVDRLVIASFGMEGYPGFKPGKNGVFIVLPADEPGRWKKFNWYTPGAGEGKHYGRWSFLSDGATAGNGKVENWFELLDSWLDEAGGGVNGYAP